MIIQSIPNELSQSCKRSTVAIGKKTYSAGVSITSLQQKIILDVPTSLYCTLSCRHDQSVPAAEADPQNLPSRCNPVSVSGKRCREQQDSDDKGWPDCSYVINTRRRRDGQGGVQPPSETHAARKLPVFRSTSSSGTSPFIAPPPVAGSPFSTASAKRNAGSASRRWRNCRMRG